MKVLLNIIWLIFGGFFMALAWFFFGMIMCILIITIPFGLQAFKIGGFALWPFGRTLVDKPDANSPLRIVGNIIWLILGGIELAIGHLIVGVIMCLTIIGIPLGIANFKMIPVSLIPFGREIVPTEVADARAGISV